MKESKSSMHVIILSILGMTSLNIMKEKRLLMAHSRFVNTYKTISSFTCLAIIDVVLLFFFR